MLVGMFVNAVMLLGMYWRLLGGNSVEKSVEEGRKDNDHALDDAISVPDDVASHQFSPVHMSHRPSFEDGDDHRGLEFESPNRRASKRGDSNCDVETGAGGSKEMGPVDSFSRKLEERLAVDGEVGLREMASQVEDGLETEKNKSKKENFFGKWKRKSWKVCLYLITIGMLIALLMGLNMSWTVLTAALILMVLDFKDAGPCLDKVFIYFLIS